MKICVFCSCSKCSSVTTPVVPARYSKSQQLWISGVVREIWPDGSVHVQYENQSLGCPALFGEGCFWVGLKVKGKENEKFVKA